MCFPDRWIVLIHHCVEHCWFSVLVNGHPAGFFPSSRGLRQGDPLSPALFVLAADYFSRGLDAFMERRRYMCYQTNGPSRQISHLAYAYDVIIFGKAHQGGLFELIQFLEHYSAVSGQAINFQKSNFFLSRASAEIWGEQIQDWTGFRLGSF